MRRCDGTSADYMRHRRAGETPCPESKKAWRERQREYRARPTLTVRIIDPNEEPVDPAR